MSRTTLIMLALALGLTAAPLAFGQGSTPGGATAATPPAETHKAPEKSKSKSSGKSTSAKVDLNSASRGELEKLPGLGEATADRIIAARPLKSSHDLVAKGIVTQAEFNKISPHVMTKPVAAK